MIELTLFTENGREGEVSRSEGIRGILTKVNPLLDSEERRCHGEVTPES